MSSAAVMYNAWFCPFAQRGWIGARHRKLNIEIKEQDPYDKSPEWLAINPRGLVPSLIHNKQSIYESTILLEYYDEAWPEHDGPTVMPSDPFRRFQARAWADHISKKIVPPYYAMLQKKSDEDRAAAGKQILTELKYMFDEKPVEEGPFYLGDQLGFVDIMLFPHAYRIQLVLGHFRNFSIPKEGFERFHEWFANVVKCDAVRGTLADEQKLIGMYQRYADNTAKTLVADAIRQGTAFP